KGSYQEFTTILNVRSLSSDVVRAANPISKAVTKAVPKVTSVYLYEDKSPGDYYMGSPSARTHRVWGKSDISIEIHGRTFTYPPVAFSQVNPGIAEQLVIWAEDLLEPGLTLHFYDLYCGYGLFALCLADRFEQVIGVEGSDAAIDAAKRNARWQYATNARFLRCRIGGEEIQKILRPLRAQRDVVLLDPPRNGTDPGVLDIIAAARPARIVHVFCNLELIPTDLARWRRLGYVPRRAVPFDMFPGTDALECMVLMENAV
ncbi:MAG: class I SAM-dependent RNA methyltransferase, partial [Candidatus Xenobia bacterium]